ncbi:MAG: hypothetical protein COB49_11820 [Alphaproteobacteria bacterium]|nr:MAG: hypothetical protein COB49_11820 [Alphaproteobacteria bacterium]
MRKNATLLVALFVSQLLTVWPNWTQATEAAEDREYPAPSTLIPKAKNGDIWSQFTLGYIYSHGKGVGPDYKKALKWFTKAAEQDDLISQYYLATILEEGSGEVAQDYGASANWYLKIAKLGHVAEHKDLKIFAARKIGYFYADGMGVEQDYKAAIKWLTEAALQGDSKAQVRLGLLYMNGEGVSRNPAAANKWLQLSANGVNQKVKALLPSFTKELNVDGFLYARARWREKFPAYMQPFGIVLGKRFPAELNYNLTDTFNANIYPSIGIYKDVTPPLPFTDKSMNTDDRGYYTVYTSKTSDSVYKISSRFQFDSEDHCRRALMAFFNDGLAVNTAPKIMSDWHRVSGYSDPYNLFVADFGETTPPANPDEPLKLDKLDHLSGVRLILSCRVETGSTLGEMKIIHFPSVEKAVAQFIKSTPKWAAFYDKQKNEGKRPVYMDPFGIEMGRPLAKAISLTEEQNYLDSKYFETAPPSPHKLFSDYSVSTSRSTNSVFSLTATARFKSRDHCLRVMNGSANGFSKKLGSRRKAKNVWYDVSFGGMQKLSSNFQLTPEGMKTTFDKDVDIDVLDTEQNLPGGSGAYFQVNVALSCLLYRDSSHWNGTVSYSHPLTYAVALAEVRALNLLTDF